ncbi:Protein yippee-like [Melia azedarach]|uniref:Protein yippee-like n=1 Tax=Melia azedarach TaxID=155640 RepID=A0ACC1XG22_MELAZ|nr:Protein yippee-like [Melia azedarach]
MAGQHILIVEFDRNPDSRFFLCRSCSTHITLSQEVVFEHKPTGAIIMKKAENVMIDHFTPWRRANRTTMAAVHCVRCFTGLGNFFVAVENPSDVFQQGFFLLSLRKLMYWNGSQVVDPMET